ncbi:hypothetical protein GCM10023205_18660 [Yinghuangia aomiensis]|uniref:Histidine kinase/HSP90-like ATPase domain-containing protein n=1 Tax=Yinghuangia aomiensis TaxID=676205 RepID=A0ABP9GZD4_9ACTN
MNARPQLDGHRTGMLRRWSTALWFLFGMAPLWIAAKGDSGAAKYWSFALPAVLGACHAVLVLFPENRAVRPRTFLWVLVLGMGPLAYLHGGAALYVVSLPILWIHAGGPTPAIAFSGAGAATTVLGGTVDQGWSPDLMTGNNVVTVVAYAAGTLLGLWLDQVLGLSNERARRLAAELEQTQRRLAEAHQRQGAAEERERLAREIHDTLAQSFASIVVLAEAARSGLESTASPKSPESLESPNSPQESTAVRQLLSIERTARESLAEARVLVGSAPQTGVVPGSLAPALRRTLDRFAEDTGLTVDADLADVACDRHARIALLRCTQESLANVRKHADATTVGVVLAPHPDGVELEITDDGRGFVPGQARGFGLDGMCKRLDELGGELTVTSSVGYGTRILAMIPTNGQV